MCPLRARRRYGAVPVAPTLTAIQLWRLASVARCLHPADAEVDAFLIQNTKFAGYLSLSETPHGQPYPATVARRGLLLSVSYKRDKINHSWLAATSALSICQSAPILRSVSAHPPPGSASISASPTVAPGLQHKLSQATRINDSSTAIIVTQPSRGCAAFGTEHRLSPITLFDHHPPPYFPSPGWAVAHNIWWENVATI